MRAILKINPKFLIPALFSLVVIIELWLFGFRPGDDGPRWMAAAKFFLGQFSQEQVWYHVVFNPIFGLIVMPLNWLGVGLIDAYELVNLAAFLSAALVLVSLIRKLTGNYPLSLVTGCLFLVDFQTLQQTFLIYPDILTWLTIAIILNFAVDIWLSEKQATLQQTIQWGLLLSIATLLKTNLGFLFPVYPAIILMKNEKGFVSLTATASIVFLSLVGGYYVWVWNLFHHFPWDHLAESEQRLGVLPLRQTLEFIPTYLYLWPLIILGFFRYPFKFPKILMIIFLITTAVPVFIWPYSASRFNFTTFWFFLPIAAAGLISITKNKKILIIIAMIGLLIMDNLRLIMTASGQSHLEFISNLGNVFGLYGSI